MTLTAIEGVVRNGQIRLSEQVALPENTRVYVIVAEASGAALPAIRTPRLADPRQAGDFRKEVLEVPGDAKL